MRYISLATSLILSNLVGKSAQSSTKAWLDLARDEFLGSLTEQEKSLFSPCASDEDLIRSIEKLELIVNQKARGKRFFLRIESFCNHLKPYFDILNSFTQSNQYAAFAWGSLRLILQVWLSIQLSCYGSVCNSLKASKQFRYLLRKAYQNSRATRCRAAAVQAH